MLVAHPSSLAPEPGRGYVAAMSELTEAQMHEVADRLLAGIMANDEAAVRAVYAPDAKIWHNFDQREQTVDENLATLHDMHRRATKLQYTEIQRFLSPGGFVQQHVLTGEAKGGPLLMPAMIRFWVEDRRITRLEEYLDTRQAMVMYSG
jgi:ketosteroid isomerase-like protein